VYTRADGRPIQTSFQIQAYHMEDLYQSKNSEKSYTKAFILKSQYVVTDQVFLQIVFLQIVFLIKYFFNVIYTSVNTLAHWRLDMFWTVIM
jgi:hypothetical protein